MNEKGTGSQLRGQKTEPRGRRDSIRKTGTNYYTVPKKQLQELFIVRQGRGQKRQGSQTGTGTERGTSGSTNQ